MKINPLHFSSLYSIKFGRISQTNHIKPLNIEDENLINSLNADTFTKTVIKTNMPGIYGSKNITGTLVKKINLKNSKGDNIEGFIIKDTKEKDVYYACTKENALCYMRLGGSPMGENQLFVGSLYGQSNNGEYKGAGTELIKFAIEKSKKEGLRGRIGLSMGGSQSFYFKNNFRIPKNYPDHLKKDAVLDYMTRHNIAMNQIRSYDWLAQVVTLDEHGAKALLDDTRFFDSSKSETMYSKNISNGLLGSKKGAINVDVDFSDLTRGETQKKMYVIQLIAKNSENYFTPMADLEMQLMEDSRGNKYLEAKDLRFEEMNKRLARKMAAEIFKAARIKAWDLNAEYIDIENLNFSKK